MNDSLPAAQQLERHLGFVLAARQSLRDLTLFAIAWGVAVLAVRASMVQPPLAALWWAAAAIPIVIAIASIRGVRRRPPRAALVALLDSESHSGGLLMAAESADIGAWRSKLDGVSAPRIQFDARRPSWYASGAFVFALGALLVPQRQGAEAHHALDVSSDIHRVETRLKLLEEEKVLPPDRAEAMKQSLAQLRKEASGDDPAKALETLDSLSEATSRAAKDAAESALRKTEALTRVEALAGVMEGHKLEGDDLAAGMRTLANEASNPEVFSNLSPEEQQAVAKGTLTDAQLKNLGNSARSGKESLRRTLDKLNAAGMIDPKTLARQGEAADAGDWSDLAKYLHDHMAKEGMSHAMRQWQGGRGGVDRGRGDAPMFYGEKADPKGAKWKSDALPPTNVALQESRIIGLSAAAPDPSHPQTSAGGALDNAAAGGGSAFTASVLPRHRGTVKRFFERK